MRLKINTLNSQRQGSQISNSKYSKMLYKLLLFPFPSCSSAFFLALFSCCWLHLLLCICKYICDCFRGHKRGCKSRFNKALQKFHHLILYFIITFISCCCCLYMCVYSPPYPSQWQSHLPSTLSECFLVGLIWLRITESIVAVTDAFNLLDLWHGNYRNNKVRCFFSLF